MNLAYGGVIGSGGHAERRENEIWIVGQYRSCIVDAYDRLERGLG